MGQQDLLSDAAHNNDLRGDILKEFIRVVHNVIPVLDQVKSNIEESSHTIPKASLQLNSVTQATESATLEILNVLDSMTRRIEGFETLLSQLEDRKIQLQTLGAEISRALDVLCSRQPGDSAFRELRTRWSEYFGLSSNPEIVGRARQSLSEARDEAMSIAMALQVQDITTQQIAGVINLIESVRTQLVHILASLECNRDMQRPVEKGPGASDARSDAFNSDAEYSRSPERQEMADDIISEWSNTEHRKKE